MQSDLLCHPSPFSLALALRQNGIICILAKISTCSLRLVHFAARRRFPIEPLRLPSMGAVEKTAFLLWLRRGREVLNQRVIACCPAPWNPRALSDVFNRDTNRSEPMILNGMPTRRSSRRGATALQGTDNDYYAPQLSDYFCGWWILPIPLFVISIIVFWVTG